MHALFINKLTPSRPQPESVVHPVGTHGTSQAMKTRRKQVCGISTQCLSGSPMKRRRHIDQTATVFVRVRCTTPTKTWFWATDPNTTRHFGSAIFEKGVTGRLELPIISRRLSWDQHRRRGSSLSAFEVGRSGYAIVGRCSKSGYDVRACC